MKRPSSSNRVISQTRRRLRNSPRSPQRPSHCPHLRSHRYRSRSGAHWQKLSEHSHRHYRYHPACNSLMVQRNGLNSEWASVTRKLKRQCTERRLRIHPHP